MIAASLELGGFSGSWGLHCANVQHIGNLLVLWRENPKSELDEKSAPGTRRQRKPANKKQAAAMLERRKRKPAQKTSG